MISDYFFAASCHCKTHKFWITVYRGKNKLAKARKTRTSPNTLGLKKFGLGKLWVRKVFQPKNTFGKYTFGKYTFEKYT